MSDINNEELSAFVTSTLNAVSSGVALADAAGQFRFDLPNKIEFEVAVTALKAKEGSGGLRIQVFSAEGKASSEDEHVSRIRFEVGRVHASRAMAIDYTNKGKGVV